MVGIFVSTAFAETFHVAPDGNDGGAGTLNDPWATLVGARENVRPYLDGSGDIIVYFRGGTYKFTSAVVFGPNDGGTPDQKITYAAYPGESPIFSSLVQVTGWSAYNENIMQATLPEGINHVRYLHDQSENWMERSATSRFSTTENAGGEDGGCIECNWDWPATQPDKSNIQYPSGFSAPNWSYANQFDLRQSSLMWHQEILPISSVNTSQRRIYTSVPGLYDMRKDCCEVSPQAWILNSIEGIDTVGEWACINNTIYLWPSSSTSDIYVPQLTEIVRVDAGGDGLTWSGIPVQYINFIGITFTGGDFRIMENGDVTAQHDWLVVDEPDSLLRIRNAANITVQNCTFTKSGGGGVRLDRYAQNILITKNTFTYLGRTGVGLSGRGPGYGDVNTFNEVSSNYIEGLLKK